MEENAPTSPAAPPLLQPPPPVPPPPPIIVPPSPPQRTSRRNWGWMVLALVLLVVLGYIGVSHFLSSLFSPVGHRTRTGGPRLEEVMTEDNDANDKIAVVPIEGIITSRNIDQTGLDLVELVKAQLKRAEEDSRVKAVILKVDSPGGEVLASDEIYRAIASFQTNAHKPVVASMGNVAASGGYYVSSPCRWIVANDMTITGSIGVIMHTWNYRGLMDKVGLRPQTYKSGKFKDMLSPERTEEEIPPEEGAMVQAFIDETYKRFKEVVAAGRKYAHDKNKDEGEALSDDWTDYADGRILSGTEALKHGFVDQLGNFQDAVARAKKIAGIGPANLVQFQARFDLSDIFRLFGKSEGKAIKVDLGMEPPRLRVGQLYFLWAAGAQ